MILEALVILILVLIYYFFIEQRITLFYQKV